ncbi:hypothetical protein [Clostridium botulinum]|uniref:hypothetical protein n=1 Tax=Clostridium botulinum TaxID=1491 RepID=UPI000A175565|nr:hypothetical protein [Clostridium botulinum]AUN11222.1 hypothetical protein RSJ6_12210 [Clostridium botulinum]OSA67454.1 hypothetical protein B2H87_16235 [Clostridium botulinum]OSB09277.1 hypothetical protein B2H96_17205 [Clostridium botulinum]
MSSYAFKDPDRKIKIYAKDCNSSNKNIEYYCPTPNCKAKVTLRSLNGDYNPYFSPLRSKSHSDFCPLGKLTGKNTSFDVSDFSIESLYNLIISKDQISNSSKKNQSSTPNSKCSLEPITTPSNLYYFCKGHDINYYINNNLKVKDLIADSRTNFFFTKGIWGLKLVEVKFHQFDDKIHNIMFNYPLDNSCKNKHRLTVKFDSDEHYIKTKNKIFNTKKDYSSVIIGILGNWTKDSCIIKHWKQIIII